MTVYVSANTDYDQRMKKSVCYSYSVIFIIMMLRYLDRADWLQKTGPILLQNMEPGKIYDDTSTEINPSSTATEYGTG